MEARAGGGGARGGLIFALDKIEQILAALRGVAWLRIVAAPLLGAIIGYITNDLALKMLFRPYEEVRIGRFHVPFTPGLIPSQKSRIAKSLGAVIAGKLLDEETLSREALSDAAMEKLRGVIGGWLEAQASDERALRERIGARVPPDRLEELQGKLADRATDYLMEKLRGAGLGEIVAEQVLAAIRGKLAHLPMGFLFDGAVESGPALIRGKIVEAEAALLDKSASDLTAAYRERIPALTEALLGLYRELFERHIGALLAAARLDAVIERRIESFDARELEQVVFGVMRRELRAIVYLGALLGCLMGFVNLLF